MDEMAKEAAFRCIEGRYGVDTARQVRAAMACPDQLGEEDPFTVLYRIRLKQDQDHLSGIGYIAMEHRDSD